MEKHDLTFIPMKGGHAMLPVVNPAAGSLSTVEPPTGA